MNTISADWLSSLLTSEPADRPWAQSALHDLYDASGLPVPNHFFWFESPFRATLAMILLTAATDSLLRQTVAAMERVARERELLEEVREELARRDQRHSSGSAQPSAKTRMPRMHWRLHTKP